MEKPSVGERFRYWFDGVMSRGVVALMGLLALASLVFIAAVSLVVLVFHLYPQADGQTETLSFPEAVWSSLMRTLDSGTMGGDEGPGFRAAMLVVTIGGVILVASLISVISNAFDGRVEELRKGRSRVLESDHTLILGWSSKVFPIISELCLPTSPAARPRSSCSPRATRSRWRTRSGPRSPARARRDHRAQRRPHGPHDLEVASPHAARSVIILAPEDSADPDAFVIKTALALTNNPRRKEGSYHIVGEIRDPGNLEAARLVGKDEADWILTGDLISRITVQTSRQSGLSIVYTELLDFDGDEIYFSEQPSLVGRTYFDAQLAFEASTVIGIVSGRRRAPQPAADTVYGEGDKLILDRRGRRH